MLRLRLFPINWIGALLMVFIGVDAWGSSINLSWRDNSNNEDGFKVERSADGIRFEEIAVVGADVTIFEDRGGLELKQVYVYRVRAFNVFGHSGYSETVTTLYDPPPQFYFGHLGMDSEGSFAMMARADGSGVFVGEIDLGDPVVWVEKFQLSENGAFSFYVAGLGTFSGEIREDAITGALDLLDSNNGGSDFSIASSELSFGGVRELGNGDTQGIAGFYDFGSGAAERLIIIAGPNGKGFVVSVTDGHQSAGAFNLNENESTVLLEDGSALSISFGGSGEGLDVTIDHDVQRAVVEGIGDGSKRSVLVNVSIRARVDGGAIAIAGFVVSGRGEKQLLVRAIGPTLETRGLANVASDTRLILYRQGIDGFLAENDDWSDVADQGEEIEHFTRIAGAFPLPRGSKDAAFVIQVPEGLYWAHVENKSTIGGTALVEIYDLDEIQNRDTDAVLANVSLRGVTGQGREPIIAGFVISGDEPKGLLIRAMGRELQDHGVTGTLDDPKFSVYGMGGGVPIAGNDDWMGDRDFLSGLAAQVGAFPFADDSKSAAEALWLDAGLYTVVAAGGGSGVGEVLLEVYAIP